MALQWYLLSNDTQSLEGSIVLTQAALERLSQELDGDKGNRSEGKWIADALEEANICVDIPPQLGQNLGKRFMKKWSFDHGPHTLVEIRNDLLHSDMRLKTIRSDIYAQARAFSAIGLWYVELMLTEQIRLRWPIRPDRSTQEWQGQVERVPSIKTRSQLRDWT